MTVTEVEAILGPDRDYRTGDTVYGGMMAISLPLCSSDEWIEMKYESKVWTSDEIMVQVLFKDGLVRSKAVNRPFHRQISWEKVLVMLGLRKPRGPICLN